MKENPGPTISVTLSLTFYAHWNSAPLIERIHFEFNSFWIIFYKSIHFFQVHSISNSAEPAHMSRIVASDLVQHCLLMSHELDITLILEMKTEK